MYDLEKIRASLINQGKLKQCKQCNKIFPATVEHFYRNKRSKDELHYYCKECSNENAVKYSHSKKAKKRIPRYRNAEINKTIITYFLKKYCEYGKYMMRYEFLYRCATHFCLFFNEHSFTRSSFTHFLKQNTRISFHTHGVGKSIRRSQKKILGIRLNSKGIKRFGVENKANLVLATKNIDNKELSHKEACLLVSCHPGQEKFRAIYEGLDDHLKTEIDYDKTMDFYKKIETYLFKKNIYRATKIKIAVAIKLGSTLSQKASANITGTTYISLRNLLRLITANIELIYKSEWEVT